MTIQRIYFPANRQYVRVVEFDNGTFIATFEDVAKDWLPGRGPTLLSAIADLTERNTGVED